MHPTTSVLGRPPEGWGSHQRMLDQAGYATPEVDALYHALRRKRPEVATWPAFYKLVEAGMTPEPKRLLKHVSTLNGQRWEVWRWAVLATGRIDFMLSIELYGRASGVLLHHEVVPISLEPLQVGDPHGRFKVLPNQRTKLLTPWRMLTRQLAGSGVLQGLADASGIYVSRLNAGIAEVDVRRGGPDHPEVAHLDRCSLNDNFYNLHVMAKAEHDAYDSAVAAPSVWIAGLLTREEQAEYEAWEESL